MKLSSRLPPRGRTFYIIMTKDIITMLLLFSARDSRQHQKSQQEFFKWYQRITACLHGLMPSYYYAPILERRLI